jgi:transcriptional regulator with XRE-family HTH domain
MDRSRDKGRVRERRDKLKLSQKQLAALAGVHQSQVSRAEGAGEPPSDVSLAKIAAALAAVETSGGTAATGLAVARAGSMGTVLEVALGEAFDPARHLLRDAVAVQREFETVALPQMTVQELQQLCGQWLDAAARLRADGTPITAQAIVAFVSVQALRPH